MLELLEILILLYNLCLDYALAILEDLIAFHDALFKFKETTSLHFELMDTFYQLLLAMRQE